MTLFFLNITASSARAAEPAELIFINHVRGAECCDSGSLENFNLQLKTFAEQKLPAFFALRYDALTDPEFIKLITQFKNNPQIQFGAMLEITPELARTSFVTYKDTPENWYQAQNAFLIGYSPEDRLLLADKIFAAYQEIFGTYPEFTSAWQVDTPTLNYLQKQYGLIAHQIAREQWGLDSYTLDGGPPHYPYLASKNWIFNPDFSDPNHLLIIRHTIDDPLYTYGDDSSAFTSQPNDYTLDQKNFDYFNKLLDQIINQPNQPGFANLGLENSMAYLHQKEYLKQIARVVELKNEGKISLVANLETLKRKIQNQKISLHQGRDLITSSEQKVFWITTAKYRLRLRFNKNKVFISDLRIYHPQLIDPYNTQPALNKGYLINPYLLNDGIQFANLKQATWAQRFLKIPVINSFAANPKKDLTTNLNFLALPATTDFASIKIEFPNTISYQSGEKTIALNFQEETFKIKNIEAEEIKYIAPKFDKNPIKFKKSKNQGEIFWEITQKKALATHWNCFDLACHFEFTLDPTKFSQMISSQYPFIFPEKKPRLLSEKNTIIYLHNRYALANRNPVRVILVPQDKNGFPTNSQEEVVVLTQPEADFIFREKQTTSHEYQLLDISHTSPAQIKLKLALDEIKLPEQTIFFAPNCKNQLAYCLTHPQEASWYLRTIIEDKLRAKLLDEKQE